MTVSATSKSTCIAARLQLIGLVQGVGMRPFVARLAGQHGLNGFVRNNDAGVEIYVEGSAASMTRFVDRLQVHTPVSARVDRIRRFPATVLDASEFTIQETSVRSAAATCVPVDVGMCEACRNEVLSPEDRRRDYPFTTCTTCGPRYSLIEGMPFDRGRTTMRSFTPCLTCEEEYRNADDRRFHSQTNACSECGPHVSVRACGASGEDCGSDAIRFAAEAIRRGLIVALKGVGGYQLVCDATSNVAVKRLRDRKQRPKKPLAVMVLSVDAASDVVRLNSAEVAAFTSPQNPIVVLNRRCPNDSQGAAILDSVPETRVAEDGQSAATEAPEVHSCLAPATHNQTLSAEVSPDLNHVGMMLPTSPLHLLLLKQAGVPCVVTSGNPDGDPLAYEQETVEECLQGIADVWLHHDRSIVRPIDDSVVRVINHRAVTIRAGRGLAPMRLPVQSRVPILAVGGQQKIAVALSTCHQAILGPHIGDMNSVAARERFAESVDSISQLYDTTPAVIAHDAHPDYFTTQWARDSGKRTIAVQHHHAHIVAGMLEHNWMERQVLGVAFDGTGYGTDGTIWGGEFLLSTASGFRRVARLRPFPLIGGERAVREPWRIATALLHLAGVGQTAGRCSGEQQRASVLGMLRRNARYGADKLHPMTSSMGRLFDGVASLILNIDSVSYEGEAAMRLEACGNPLADGHYDLPMLHSDPAELDWRPMVRQIVADIHSNVSAGIMATRFIRGVAVSVGQICRKFSEYPVVLSGGCFQNSLLTEFVTDALQNHRAPVGFPGLIPPNDGGLAAGQLAIAAAILENSDTFEGAR